MACAFGEKTVISVDDVKMFLQIVSDWHEDNRFLYLTSVNQKNK